MFYFYRSFLTKLAFVLVVATCIASATQALAQRSDSSDSPQDVVLMGIGGWGSCAEGRTVETQYIAPQVKRLKKKLERQLSAEYNIQIVFICSPYPVRSSSGSTMMNYRILASTQRLVDPSRRVRPQSGRVAESNVVSLLRKIQREFHHPLTYVFGHSHGGFTAMKAVGASPLVVKGLYTMEPIDASACNTRQFLRNQLGLIPVATCRQSPRMNANRYAQVARNADGNWHNFTFRHRRGEDNGELYSSVIPGNHTTEHVLGIHYDSRTHHNLGLDSVTWSEIFDDVIDNIESHSSNY